MQVIISKTGMPVAGLMRLVRAKGSIKDQMHAHGKQETEDTLKCLRGFWTGTEERDMFGTNEQESSPCHIYML